MQQLALRAYILALSLMFSTPISWAQITGDLEGNVHDATGASVPMQRLPYAT